ncbi:hypothetical protein [Streptomyces sp. NPDC058295]|uniref:hypothetical protein n=1 Tax=Streptomyces sp. NPDC058295 TaxID=3346431 RepID=UPI0036E5FCE0
MIKKLSRMTAVLALALLSPAAPATAAPALPVVGPAIAGSTPATAQDVPLFQALEWIGEAPESRDGYSRGQFKHRNRGLDLGDGCDTRRE